MTQNPTQLKEGTSNHEDKSPKSDSKTDQKNIKKSGVADIAMVSFILICTFSFFSTPRENISPKEYIDFKNGNWPTGFVIRDAKPIGFADYLENEDIYRMESVEDSEGFDLLQPGNELFEKGICLTVSAHRVRPSTVYGISLGLENGSLLHLVINEERKISYFEFGQQRQPMSPHSTQDNIEDKLDQVTVQGWQHIQIAATSARLDGWLNEMMTWERVNSKQIEEIIDIGSLSIVNVGLFVRSGAVEFRNFHVASYTPDCHAY